ncbi:HAD-IA family hydrolase [Microbacterium sp. NM3R9]|uniref:HAD family hydrolase n=1 Tax=Microbacterium thalli TaxID=3027921 RepID=UPI002365F05E|nr:HAD-IA family hydrolase [Microbacterium thalli]MDN8548874.1 HAD-IA family hydrolase [Microbacterium thalli]
MRYDAVVFDLLTALVDSWSLWDSAAGSQEQGRRWRGRYLQLTYGAETYRPYEDLVMEAAQLEDVAADSVETLVRRWDSLSAWPEAPAVLRRLQGKVRTAVVTNCSEELGMRAAISLRHEFDVFVTSERAGYYKPRPEPYRLALSELGTAPERTLFVAGSRYDIPGAGGVGMPVWWHNRIGMDRGDLPAPLFESTTLESLPAAALS